VVRRKQEITKFGETIFSEEWAVAFHCT
jgi:hypothetical protein